LAGIRGLYLDTGDVLAAADDDVLDPVHDVDAAGFVDPNDVSGVQPSVDDGLGVRLLAVPVAGGHVGTPDDQLPGARIIVDGRDTQVDRGHGVADRVGVLDRVLVR
jgi:hypothetical protein